MNKIICPICGNGMCIVDKTYRCDNRHTYDISKYNYVNFLPFGKSHGDNK